MVSSRTWDVAVVGAGPAGATAALAARRAGASVLLLDRVDFPRDKACGDGVAPHVLDLLAGLGVTGLLDDRVPVHRLRIGRGDTVVDRRMARPSYVVPRRVLDARLLSAALDAGACFERHRVRRVQECGDGVVIDDLHRARVVVGCDGARSEVRRLVGRRHDRWALAVRGYAPVTADRTGAQVIAFGLTRQPSYAWSFDAGDGTSNVGYGEVLAPGTSAPSRARLVARLEELLPGTTVDGAGWRGHHLPLSGPRWRPPTGRVLLAGDAAGLVNPLTGEGIYYAVATGAAAGHAAATSAAPGRAYASATRRLLLPHLRHTALTARLSSADAVLGAGLAAAAHDQRFFDDLVELGLARGRITPRIARGLAASLIAPRPRPSPEKSPSCAS